MIWDKEKALESLDGDKDLFQELINLFVDTMATDLEKIKQGQNDNQNTEIISGAHSIKGSSVTLGFDSIHHLAEKVEQNAKSDNNSTLESDIEELEKLLKKTREISFQ